MDVPLETRALETSHTVFDSVDAPEALFILQTLKLSVGYKSTLLFHPSPVPNIIENPYLRIVSKAIRSGPNYRHTITNRLKI
jgi:hypothetical protein